MGREEDHVVAQLIALFRDLEVKCLVQVGAEDGFEAAAIAKALDCEAAAIDADPRTKGVGGVLFFHALIGAESKENSSFFLHEASTPTSTGLSSQIRREQNGEEEILMPEYSLDDWCDIHSFEPDALIIDTEGTTLEVLKGAETILAGVKVVYAEVQGFVTRPGIKPFPLVQEFMEQNGFKRYDSPPTYGVGDGQWNQTWVRKKQ